jgi:NhaP-type Na+/H+ or K+/H+ antiporter
MSTLLVYSVTLLVAVLVSELARRSVLSTAVMFLLAGFLAGGVFNAVKLEPGGEQVKLLSELALFSVLYTDGMRVQITEIRRSWNLPARALLLGMPLTLAFTGILAHLVVGLPWDEALLLAAVLSPTDPVLANAIIGRDEVPLRLRRLLNLESGLNDGLALPFVLVLLTQVGEGSLHPGTIGLELLFGIVIGVVIPMMAIQLESGRFFASAPLYEPLLAVAVGLLVLSVTSLTGTNMFLGAFTAGIVLANVSPRIRERFDEFGEILTELLKLAAILLFGALISVAFLREISLSGYLFAALTLTIVRPAALGISLLGGRLPLGEWAAAAWFGPKGFASVVFALIVVVENTPDANLLFHLAALVVAFSILVHSTTDVLVARRLSEVNTGESRELASSETGSGVESLSDGGRDTT